MAVLYKSKFVKADMRIEQILTGKRLWVTQCGNEIVLKDVFLMPGAKLNVVLEKDKLNLIFPIVGGIVLTEVEGELQLSPEEVYCYSGADEEMQL